MSYDGHVSPGGPAATRELDALTITKVSVGPMDNNAYLLECRASGELLLVDAAADATRLLDLLGDLYLFGGPPIGALSAFRPGHAANHRAVAEALGRGILSAQS